MSGSLSGRSSPWQESVDNSYLKSKCKFSYSFVYCECFVCVEVFFIVVVFLLLDVVNFENQVQD